MEYVFYTYICSNSLEFDHYNMKAPACLIEIYSTISVPNCKPFFEANLDFKKAYILERPMFNVCQNMRFLIQPLAYVYEHETVSQLDMCCASLCSLIV
jgi:hypothetical protein